MSGKLLNLAVCLSLCLLTPLRWASAVPPANINVGYLVDQNFVIGVGTPENQVGDFTGSSKLSDWEVDSKAGSTVYSYWNYLTIQDNSSTSRFEMRKPFLPQSSGTISVEFRFSMQYPTDDMVWAVRAGRDKSLVEFTTSGGNFGYLDVNNHFQPLIAVVADTAYTVHLDLSLFDTTGTIYIDGVNMTHDAPIARNLNLGPASQFYIGTSMLGTNPLRMYYVTVVKGYKVLERFTNAKANYVPANWTATTTGGTASVQAAHGSNPKDILSFRLNDTVAASVCTVGRTFTASTSKLVWEYKFMLPTAQDGVKMQLRSGGLGGTNAVTIITTATSLFCLTNSADMAKQIWVSYKPNIWYVVRVVADPATHTTDIYVNGKPVATGVTFNNSVGSLDSLAFTSSATTTGTVWIDDVLVYDFQPDALDYVPDVQPVTVSMGKKVGIQTFFAGWREGQHQGWDWVYRFPDHDPSLGFSDGGSPEGMDWQLKWMAECGTSFFLDCWFSNPMNSGVVYPMKEPLFEYTQGPLHSGYFYAKYSNKVKFAIADYSVQTLTAAQFQAYILPYWREYYFNDPRYYVIPSTSGKKGYPVVSLGTAVDWVTKPPTGDTDAMKNSITALRAALVADGFDGVVVLANYTSAAPATLTALHDAGIDYVYAYWGRDIVSGTNPSSTQSRLQDQLNVVTGTAPNTKPVIVPIPDGGQGYSGEAWDLARVNGKYTTLVDFGANSDWMRTDFPKIKGVSTGILGVASNTVFFDNWNEYGEGHFLAPTAVHGVGYEFGYLDAIRTTFAGISNPPPAASHFDASPTEAQKTRLNTLYARGWDGRNWGFDSLTPDTEGWTANSGIATGSLVQNKGYLEGTSSNIDPSILSRDGYNIDGLVNTQIKVRMKKSGTAPSYGRFYFTTNDASDLNHLTFDQAKSVNFPLNNNTDYQEYVVNMWTAPEWANSIRQLRFDPVDTGAVANETFSIDYIRIVSQPNPGWVWGFDTLDGWTANGNISNFVPSGSYVNGNITGPDPYIVSEDGANLNAAAFKKVKVLMKNSSANSAAKLYFITAIDGTYNETKAKSVAINGYDQNFTEYTFDMSAIPSWTGTIRQLRLDVGDSRAAGGSFSIDYILLAN